MVRLAQGVIGRMAVSLLVVMAAGILAGCATVTRGTTEELVVESEPAGARVAIQKQPEILTLAEQQERQIEEAASPDIQIATTPARLTLDRNGRYQVRIELEGYRSVEVKVGHENSAGGSTALMGNLLIGGAVGMAVDAGSGSTRRLYPNPIFVKLEPCP